MGILSSAESLLLRGVDGLIGGIDRIEDVKPPPLWFNATRIGGELTPAMVAQIVIQADIGYLWRLVDLARESREKDCHLHAVLSTLELSMAGMELQVIPVSDKPKDRKIAAHVEQIFANFGPNEADPQAKGLAELVQHLAGGYYYGHAVAELLYRKNKEGQTVPYAADPVMPRRFIYDQQSSRLHFFDYAGNLPYPGVDLTVAYPGHFVQFTPIVLGSGPSREGLMRPLIWAALFRNWTIRDWMALAELAWKPWRIGYYDKEKYSSKADVDGLMVALQYLTTNGSTILPSNTKLDIHWPDAKGGAGDSAHGALAGFMAAEMSKAVLGQTMTTDDGSSKAQATVHEGVRKDRRDAASRAISEALRWQVAAQSVRLNFGADAEVPLVQLVANDTDLAAMAQVLLTLGGPKGLGVPLPLRWIYKLFGVPAPQPGDEVVGNPVPNRVPLPEEQTTIQALRKRIEEQKMRIKILSDDEEALREAIDAEDEEKARSVMREKLKIDRAVAAARG